MLFLIIGNQSDLWAFESPSLIDVGAIQIVQQTEASLTNEHPSSPRLTVDSLIIRDLPKNTCLAIDLKARNCVLSVNSFNSLAANCWFTSNDVDSARKEIALQMLRMIFYDQNISQDSEIGEINDNAAPRSEIKGLQTSEEYAALDTQEQKEIYNFYYKTCFAPRLSYSVDMIASTDPSFIDSFYRALRGKDTSALLFPDSFLMKENDTIASRMGGYWWSRIPETEIPWHLLKKDAFISLKGLSKPVHTSEVSFIFRVSQVRAMNEITFFEAQKLLGRLAQVRAYGFGSVEAAALKYYRLKRKEFIPPFDVRLCMAIQPRNYDTRHGESARSRRMTAAQIAINGDTVYLNNLPSKISASIRSCSAGSESDSLHIPISTDYGFVWFSVIDTVCAKEARPFEMIKDSLVAGILDGTIPIDCFGKVPSRNGKFSSKDYVRIISVAPRYKEKQYRETMKQYETMLQMPNADESAARLYFESLVEKQQQSVESDFERWKETLEIKLP
jgi:hypothetical protein